MKHGNFCGLRGAIFAIFCGSLPSWNRREPRLEPNKWGEVLVNNIYSPQHGRST